NDKWRKTICRALHDCLFSLDKVQYVHPATRIVKHRAREPMPTSLDELTRMEPRSFFSPTIGCADRSHRIHKILASPCCRAIPLNIGQPMIEMYWPRPSVEAQAIPIPQLECEDVWCCTDLEHHAVLAGTMNRTRRNEKVIVFLCGKLIHILFRGEHVTACLGQAQIAGHLLLINSFLQTQINAGSGLGVQQIIAFVLRVMHSEFVLDVFGERMHLQRQIASTHRVEEVEANWELCAKPRMDRFPKKLLWMQKHQINRRNLDAMRAETQNNTVLLGNTVEAPGMIRRILRQIAYLLHPVPTPRAWIEVGNHAKWTVHRALES